MRLAIDQFRHGAHGDTLRLVLFTGDAGQLLDADALQTLLGKHRIFDNVRQQVDRRRQIGLYRTQGGYSTILARGDRDVCTQTLFGFGKLGRVQRQRAF